MPLSYYVREGKRDPAEQEAENTNGTFSRESPLDPINLPGRQAFVNLFLFVFDFRKS